MPSATLQIRELHAADRTRWLQLWNGYLQFYAEDLPADITEYTWSRLIDPADQPYGFAAVDGQQIIGIVHYLFHPSTWSSTEYCYLEDLFVDPNARARGAGRALIEAVYAAADQRGADRVYWFTRHDNNQARALYDKVAELVPFVQYRHGG